MSTLHYTVYSAYYKYQASTWRLWLRFPGRCEIKCGNRKQNAEGVNLKGGRWRKRHKRWSGAIKRKSRWQSLVSFLVLCQGFSCCARCPVSWVWGLPCFWLKDHDGGKQMEDYSWPNCLCPANTPPSAVRRSLRLCAPRQKLASTSAAIVSMWLMRSSLTFTFYRSGLCQFQRIDLLATAEKIQVIS